MTAHGQMNESSSALVRFSDVQKSYDGTAFAVRELDLDIRRGEFLTLLGPSGSGKTTTLMMLAGFEMPTAGEILFDGAPITRTPPHRRNFGVVFQNYALFPHLSVGDNVAYPLTVRRVPKAARRTGAVIAAMARNDSHTLTPSPSCGARRLSRRRPRRAAAGR